MRYIITILSLMLSAAFLSACGSDTSGAKGEFQLCRDYCELQSACRGGDFDEDYVEKCQSTCSSGVYDHPELDMSDQLIRCGKYDAECEIFMQCYNNGGSLTDDIYGYQEQ